MLQTHFERDADLINEDPIRVSPICTVENRFEINCSICNGLFYTDMDSIAQHNRAVELGLDNPFVCDECQDSYEQLAHER